MPFNPDSNIVDRGHLTYRGDDIVAQGNVSVKRQLSRERKKLAHSGREIFVLKDISHRITVPVLAPLAALVPILQLWQATPIGRCCAPQSIAILSINTTTNVITIAADVLATEDAVQIGWSDTAPTLGSGSLSRTTTYYARRTGAATVTLHASAADATSNTGPTDFTDDGTGALWITHEFPAVVKFASGVVRTYGNVCVEELPELVASGGELAWNGNLVLRALPIIGAALDDGDDAFFADTAAAYTAPTWDPTDLLCSAPVSAAWGASAPWSALYAEKGWRVSLKPALAGMGNGIWPSAAMKLTAFEATIKGMPLGITRPQLEAVFAEQLGEQMLSAAAATDFVLTLPGYALTLRDAVISDDPDYLLSISDNNIGDMTWTATGDSTSDINPPFAIAAV